MSQPKNPSKPSAMDMAQLLAAYAESTVREEVLLRQRTPCEVALEPPAPPPDWLTAQAKAIGTARPKKPRSAYARRWR